MNEPQTRMERAAAYKAARKARGLSQTELAKAVGVRQATISDRETGAHEFGQEAVMALRSIPTLFDRSHIDDLIEEAGKLRRQNASLERTIEMRWDADQRAITRWREAHPCNDLVMPDHADMVVWLLEMLLIPKTALKSKSQAEPTACGWDSASGKCPMAATWECLLYEGHEDEAWTPFCQHHYGLAKFHGWKIRLLNGHGDGGTA